MSRSPSITRAASAVSGAVLILGHLIALYFIYLAYMAEPAGPWDSETVAHSQFASGLVLALSLLMAALTLACVKAAWLRKGWYLVPAVLILAAVLRLTLLAPQL
ncbi:hypothetical protein ABZX40_24730 [Streptomyces sp. NPDC004610]|uniref:hypothetical protein n=1 Tax=unclassified Streptomyces TaxID=2593676 RepID=UPI0033B04C0C